MTLVPFALELRRIGHGYGTDVGVYLLEAYGVNRRLACRHLVAERRELRRLGPIRILHLHARQLVYGLPVAVQRLVRIAIERLVLGHLYEVVGLLKQTMQARRLVGIVFRRLERPVPGGLDTGRNDQCKS